MGTGSYKDPIWKTVWLPNRLLEIHEWLLWAMILVPGRVHLREWRQIGSGEKAEPHDDL